MMKAFKGGYANAQWAVVPCGLYCRKRCYLWDAASLADPDWNGGGKLSHALLHIGVKIWVDPDALIEATEMALLNHDPEGFTKLDWAASVKALLAKKERSRLRKVWEDEARHERKSMAMVAICATEFLKDREDFEAWLKQRGAGQPDRQTPLLGGCPVRPA